ncbi:hypothetical protein MACH09_46990 [Vibrio sp. MACH09]|uniref:TrbI/VirB10 family protein n=1 Tax=Vibrio sp. MACH09 TaxID=3025122 RepID=UPI00278F9CDE|nr:TrbI/VirB10 family protein [Vibrio sp. MACH09]GLO64191.1 hypothetical protein MACH09_46990 [Vibrio sp. MACH09]
MIIDRWLARFKEPVGDFDEGANVNKKVRQRNSFVTLIVVCGIAIGGVAGWWYVKPAPITVTTTESKSVDFGEVMEDGFTEKDNQSALTQQQMEIDSIHKSVKSLEGGLEGLSATIKQELSQISSGIERNQRTELDQMKTDWKNKLAELDILKARLKEQLNETGSESGVQATAVNGNGTTFGDYRYPPKPSSQISTNNPNEGEFSYNNTSRATADTMGFETSTFHWKASVEEAKAKRTVENYVPTGTFVTAVVTGGADANAGVSGQGDTAPIVFQTINSGILPNGEKSKLNNCTITGSVYGEISASRGITRTDRMSCIQPDGDILDIPVKATAFNFGRNGIRGTTILKNGKIIQMAGVSGILTGLGETGTALSQTTTPTALGPSQTVNGGDALVNLLGNATSSVGSKLAEYYIKLAELYHPIVEVNPGAVVNIVFLEGFPLDPLLADEYEAKIEQEQQAQQGTPQNQLINALTNAPTAATNQVVNPLADKLSQQGISASQFGSVQ